MKLDFTANITKTMWHGRAQIPESYFPRNVTKLNAYAIHGNEGNKVYEALYPIPQGKFKDADL